MRPNFGECRNVFLNHSADLYSHYVYNGTVHGILNGARPTLITVDGCKKLCGTGSQYYPWYANEPELLLMYL